MRRQKPQHVGSQIRIARARAIDVRLPRGRILQERFVEDRAQPPVAIGRLAHRRIVIGASAVVNGLRSVAVSDTEHVTDLLVEWGRGNEVAYDELLPLVYAELRRVAARYMSAERGDHTLQPTALVHEAYLKLVDQRRATWKNRAHFVGVAAMVMRRILVNHARDRGAKKRGGGAERVSLTVAENILAGSEVDLVDLHDALERLTALDPRAGRIVELKFFGGLTLEEVAEVLQVSLATVERDWSFARTWLYDALGNS